MDSGWLKAAVLVQKRVGGEAGEDLGQGVHWIAVAGAVDITKRHQNVIDRLEAVPLEQV